MKSVRLAIALIAIVSPLSALASFSDVSYKVQEGGDGSVYEYYHRRSVQFVEQQGIMTGYPDHTFRPSDTINRAEAMKILVEASGSFSKQYAPTNCFPDVKDQWFAPYICYAKSFQWVSGYPDGMFHPERQVTMAEFLKMLATSRNYGTARAVERGYPSDAWYAQYVEVLFQHNIVHDALLNGDRPTILATPLPRERVAEFIYLTYLSEKKLSLDLSSESDCFLPDADTFTLTTDPQNSLIHAYISKGDDGCEISNSFNPFDGIGPNDVNFHLKLVNGVTDDKMGGPPHAVRYVAPIVNGKVLLEAEGYGQAPIDFYTSGQWEFDNFTHILRQLQ